jgi:hypothetical protein
MIKNIRTCFIPDAEKRQTRSMTHRPAAIL